MQRRWMILVGAVFAAAMLVGACGDDDDGGVVAATDESGDASEDASEDPSVGVDPGGLTIEDDDQSINVGGDLPDSFPDSIELPTGYQILQAQERDYGGLLGWVVIGLVEDTTAAVRTELIGIYGEPDEDVEQNGAITLRWLDVDGLKAQFTLTPNADGDASVTLNIQEF